MNEVMIEVHGINWADEDADFPENTNIFVDQDEYDEIDDIEDFIVRHLNRQFGPVASFDDYAIDEN